MRNSKGQFLKGYGFWTGKKRPGFKSSKQFKKGQRPSPKTEFKKGQTKGKNNINWKGNNVGYFGLHTWVQRTLGKAIKCIDCGSEKNIQWANKTYKYLRNPKDWISLCRKCHVRYDKDNWGLATRIWKLKK